MLKGVLRKCRKYFLEMFTAFKGIKNIVLKNVNPNDLREFSLTEFNENMDKKGLEIALAALIFNQEII